MMSIIEDRGRAGISSLDTPMAEQSTASQVAGWFDDPDALHHLRYFDGNVWTTHVTHFGPTPCSGCG